MANMGNGMSRMSTTLSSSLIEDSTTLKHQISKLKQELSLKEDTIVCLSRENHKLKVSCVLLYRFCIQSLCVNRLSSKRQICCRLRSRKRSRKSEFLVTVVQRMDLKSDVTFHV